MRGWSLGIALALVACRGDHRAAPAPAPDAGGRDAVVDPPLPPAAPVRERRGPSWRLRGDVLEDAATWLRLQVPAGWQVLDTVPAITVAGAMVFALVPTAPPAGSDPDDVYLAFDASPIGDGDPDLHRAALVAKSADGWSDTGPPVPVTIGGHTVDVHRQVWGDPVSFERLFGAAIIDHRYLELKLQYRVADGPRLRGEFVRLVAGLGLLDAPARAALIDELERAPVAEDLVGPDYAYHDGVFRDFAQGFVWREPAAGLWRIRVIEEPEPSDPSQRLVATELLSDTTVYVGIEPWPRSPAAYLAAMRQRIGVTTITAEEPGRFADHAAATVELDVDSTVAYRMRMAHAVLGRRAVSVITDNLAAAWPGTAAAAAAETALEVAGPVPAVDDAPGAYRSARAGVDVALDGPWAPTGAWQERDGELARTWRAPGLSLQVTVIPDRLGRIVTDRGSALAPGTVTPATLAGRPVTRTRWRVGDGVIDRYRLERNGTLVQVVVTGPATSPELDRAAAAVTLHDDPAAPSAPAAP